MSHISCERSEHVQVTPYYIVTYTYCAGLGNLIGAVLLTFVTPMDWAVDATQVPHKPQIGHLNPDGKGKGKVNEQLGLQHLLSSL